MSVWDFLRAMGGGMLTGGLVAAATGAHVGLWIAALGAGIFTFPMSWLRDRS